MRVPFGLARAAYANLPIKVIFSMLAQTQANLLAVSVTMTSHLPQARELIQSVRKTNLPVRIMVGGYPFKVSPTLWQTMGADGWGADARQAVTMAETWFHA